MNRDRGLAAAVFGLATAFFMLTALPGVHWHDTAEFGAVARRLSLSHSPGHPLHALTTHLAQLLPFGDAPFRANLSSGLAVGAALGLLFGLLRRLAPDQPAGLAACAALLPAVMPAIWFQAVRAEVYGVQLLLTVGLLRLLWATAEGDRRALAGAALVFGLAGANHSLIGAALIPAALLAIAAGARQLRPVLTAVPFGALGLATYAYLPLRATAGAEVGWGRPVDAGGVWRMISAKEWTKNATAADADLVENAQRIVMFALDQVGLVGGLLLFVVAAAGLLPWLRARPGSLAGAAVAGAGFFATRFFYTFDPLNPDLAGYFAGGLIVLLAATWLAAAHLPRPAVAWAFPAVLILASPGYDPGDRQGSRSAERYARAQLAEVPLGGALVHSDYTSTFLSWGLRASEGARPDVAVVFRGQIGQPWFRSRLATQAPEWAARLPNFPAGFEGPEVRFEPGVEGQRLGPLRPRLGPAGLSLAVAGQASAAEVGAAFAAITPATPDLDARRSLGFHHVQHAIHILDHQPQHRATAATHVRAAHALVGADPFVLELSERLQANPGAVLR